MNANYSQWKHLLMIRLVFLPEIWSDKFVVRHNALYFARLEYEQPDHSSVKGRPRRVVEPRKEDYGSSNMEEAVSNFHKIYHNIN